jgi:hypothetical protein
MILACFAVSGEHQNQTVVQEPAIGYACYDLVLGTALRIVVSLSGGLGSQKCRTKSVCGSKKLLEDHRSELRLGVANYF